MHRYDFDVLVDDYSIFEERCKERFLADNSVSIEQNITDLCRWVVEKQHFVVLTNSSIQRVFSRNCIRQVVFLVRDPVESLMSWAKAERHGSDADLLGGVDSPTVLDYWAERWNQHVEEYYRCLDLGLDPVLVRYEHVRADAALHPGLAAVFADFASRPPNVRSRELERELVDRVSRNLARVYGSA